MRLISFTLLVVMLTFSCLNVQAQNVKKRSKKQTEQPVKKPVALSPYQKLFVKKHHVEKGLMTVHHLDEKIYVEIPKKLLKKDLAIASTIIRTSENGHGIAGQKPHPLVHIRFEKIDSNICMVNAKHAIRFEGNIQKSIHDTYISPIMESFKILALSPGANAYVIDMTSFFIENRPELDPFFPGSSITLGGLVSRSTNYKKNRSFISNAKAFKNNVAIESTLSYEYTLKFQGIPVSVNEPFTAVLSRSIFLLPEEPMDVRLADARIGYFTSRYFVYEENVPMSVSYLTNKWRIEPSDEAAYLRGELVEPKKKITFYMDNNFPDFWKPYIKEGIESWNIAFERAGFKNVVEVKNFPTDDPDFHVGNMDYSCVMYAPCANPNAMGPSWTDPRTGEILNASVYVYHDLIKVLRDWRFIQTAQIDTAVRKRIFSNDLMGECIRYVCAHEVGHCLGLMHNMAASDAFPVDSLRSVSFTQKYGTTPSIMDYARFNYVAQPEDKGVRLTPPTLGEYDKYAIEWGYRYFGKADARRDQQILRKMISDKCGDPIYRYGKQQVLAQPYDPSAQTEDLGDDPVKSARYGIENLKYICRHMDQWFDDDVDFQHQKAMHKGLKAQYSTYLQHVLSQVGGIYLNEKLKGDNVEMYSAVPRDKQREALKFLLSQALNLDWIDQPDLIKNYEMDSPWSLMLPSMIVQSLVGKAGNVAYGAYLSPEKTSYRVREYYQDMIDVIFDKTLKGMSLTKNDRVCQETFLLSITKPVANGMKAFNTKSFQQDYVKVNLERLNTKEEKLDFIYTLIGENSQSLISGFSFQSPVNVGPIGNLEALQFEVLRKIQKIISSKKGTGNVETRSHYDYMLQKINTALGQ